MTEWKELVTDFKHEATRQQTFTNSFWRQLLVIIVSIIIIQWAGPLVIKMTEVKSQGVTTYGAVK